MRHLLSVLTPRLAIGLLAAVPLVAAPGAPSTLAPPPRDAEAAPLHVVYLPRVQSAPVDCQPIGGASYGTLPVQPETLNPPADAHPDTNLSLRGAQATSALRGLVDYDGATDPKAPQLPGLFSDNRTPAFSATYEVNDWDWTNNRPGSPIAAWPVTLAGLATTPGELVYVPSSSNVPVGEDYRAIVLYASAERITLKYTLDDNVRTGYTIHLEKLCVEPSLLALYESSDRAGRTRLPAVRDGQAIGRARGGEVGVAIRDCGAFLDPRSRKDWWQGR